MTSMFGAPFRPPDGGSWGWGPWPVDRESRIRLLEEHQRNLEQRAADVADRIRHLSRPPTAPGPARPGRPRGRMGRREPEGPAAGWPSRRPARAAGPAREVQLRTGRRLVVRELAGPPGAPTVLLLHGWGGSALGNWGVALSTLARVYHVVAPDLDGHDGDAVDDVAALLDARGPGGVIAVGYSLGSAVAYHLWRWHPERVDGLVLCAPAGVPMAAVGDSPGGDVDVPAAVVVTERDRLIAPARQLEVARSLPGASVHRVDGNHFAFARYDPFVPALLEACRSVAARAGGGDVAV